MSKYHKRLLTVAKHVRSAKIEKELRTEYHLTTAFIVKIGVLGEIVNKRASVQCSIYIQFFLKKDCELTASLVKSDLRN